MDSLLAELYQLHTLEQMNQWLHSVESSDPHWSASHLFSFLKRSDKNQNNEGSLELNQLQKQIALANAAGLTNK